MSQSESARVKWFRNRISSLHPSAGSDLAAVATLWEAFINSGNRHFATPPARRLNRVLNVLFALNLLAGILLALAEVVFFAILLRRDEATYSRYLLPFGVLAISHPIVTLATLWLKNKTGSFHATFISNLAYTTYMVVLCLFLGERAGIHLVLLMVIPTSFIIYNYGRWVNLALHAVIMVTGLVVALVSYERMLPLYSLPADITRIGGYLSWLAALGLLYVYSIHNWREVHETEARLAKEKEITEGLLQQTIPKLEKAEAEYRHLVDDSDDLIFQTDPEGIILSMNKAAQRMLSTLPEEMVGNSIYDYIANGGQTDADFHRRMVKEQIRELLRTGKLLRLRTSLHHKHRPDGVEVLLSLQLNRTAAAVEIIAKASEVEPEVSLRFLDRENGRYTLQNNLVHAELLCQRITERVALHFGNQELSGIKTCLREVLVNAIEHGNLEVSFEEKSRVIEQQDYMEFLLARQKEARYASRRVFVHYVVNRRAFILRVTDEGAGFDHKAFMARAAGDDVLLMLEHGRGLTMTRNAFDEMVFNEKGNQVTLKKYISKNRT